MSGMLEKLAEEQYVAFWERQERHDGKSQEFASWAGQSAPIKSMWREIVRSLLTALRSPSEEMIEAGLKQMAECTDDGTATAACIPEHVFPAMIDSILQPNEGGEG